VKYLGVRLKDSTGYDVIGLGAFGLGFIPGVKRSAVLSGQYLIDVMPVLVFDIWDKGDTLENGKLKPGDSNFSFRGCPPHTLIRIL
jgi:hypothetical protein